MKLLLLCLVVFASLTVTSAQTPAATPYPELPKGLMQADLFDNAGIHFKLDDYRGKYVLLNLWATWCGPCRVDMPALQKLYKKYRGNGLEIIGLDVGDGSGDPELWKDITAHVRKYRITYRVVRGDNAIIREFYNVTDKQVVPQTILIGPDGEPRGTFIGAGPRINVDRAETLASLVGDQRDGPKARLAITVTDRFGSIIPNALVSARSIAGETVSLKNKGDGRYELDLKQGIYRIQIVKRAFETFTIDRYQVGRNPMTLDVSLICATDCTEINSTHK
jgi:thiol-disulfide isomerase/thioredoxin